MIGSGRWGRNHVRILDKLGVLAGVVDTDETLPYHRNFNELEFDAAVIATPPKTHYRIAKELLQDGKDVLVEKPMALSSEEADDLIKVTGNQILMVGHLTLYKPAVRKILEVLDLIGELQFINVRRAKYGTIRKDENVLWSFSPHDIAVLLKIINSPVKKVDWNCINLTGQEDDYHLHLTFENSVQAHIHVCWVWPEDERKTVIVGSGGGIVYDENLDRLIVNGQEIVFEKKDALEEELKHFLTCIKNRFTPFTDGKTGKDVVDVLNMIPTNIFIHESAYVDQPSRIGEGTRIWHFSHVMEDVEIGRNCTIGQNVFVGKGVKIGNNVKIQNNVSVYQGVTLEDDVFCGPSCVFTNVRKPRSNNPTDDYIPTLIKRGTTIGANATIICGITIGENAFIGAGSVVTKDVPAGSFIMGNPGRDRKMNAQNARWDP